MIKRYVCYGHACDTTADEQRVLAVHSSNFGVTTMLGWDQAEPCTLCSAYLSLPFVLSVRLERVLSHNQGQIVVDPEAPAQASEQVRL